LETTDKEILIQITIIFTNRKILLIYINWKIKIKEQIINKGLFIVTILQETILIREIIITWGIDSSNNSIIIIFTIRETIVNLINIKKTLKMEENNNNNNKIIIIIIKINNFKSF